MTPLHAAANALGHDLEDIKTRDDWNPQNGFCLAPADARYSATWGDYDLDCVVGTGRTPEEAIWDLINSTKEKP